MQATQVESLERTIQHTNEWLKAIQERMGVEDRRSAYIALRATLHALRDLLTPAEAVQLGAQMPTLVRGIYFEGWRLAGRPARTRARDEFLGAVAVDSGNALSDVERSVRAVLGVLRERISPGEIDDVRGTLPQAVRELWP